MKTCPSRRRRGRVLLAAAVCLLLLFAALVAYHKFLAGRARFTSAPDLLAELSGATLLEDEAPPADAGWPQWRGPRRDGVVHDPDLLTRWPGRGPKQLWKVAGGEGYSSFAVGGGRAYTLVRQGDQEVVLCLEADTGKERWRRASDVAFNNAYPGPRATPTLDGDRLYTVGATGLLQCLGAADGSVRWQSDLLAQFQAVNPQWGTACSPLVEGDLLLTNPGGPNGKSIVAFRKETGQVAWTALDDPAAYSSPVALTVDGVRQIVFFTARRALAVAPRDGALLWDYPWKTDFDVNAATPLAFRATHAGQTLHYVLITSDYGKGCALLKIAADGRGRFRAEPVYEGNQLRCRFSSPVRHRDQVYGLDEQNGLTCLDLRTGAVLWTKPGFQQGSLLRVDDHLLVLGERGNLALVEPDPKGYREKARAQPFRGRSWTMPILAGGKLFLRDERDMLCLKMHNR